MDNGRVLTRDAEEMLADRKDTRVCIILYCNVYTRTTCLTYETSFSRLEIL